MNVHETFRRRPGRLLKVLIHSIYVLCLLGNNRNAVILLPVLHSRDVRQVLHFNVTLTQMAFICLESTTVTPEQSVWNLFKVNNKNTKTTSMNKFQTSYKICSKLTIKTPEWRQWHRSGVVIVNFEHILNLFLVFLLLTFSKWMLAVLHFYQSIFNIDELVMQLSSSALKITLFLSFLFNFICFPDQKQANI